MKKNILYRTRTYLVGHMQYVSGRDWRQYVADELDPLNIICFDPYKKPFVKDVKEDEARRKEMLDDLRRGYYNKLTTRMRQVRSYDLNLVDRSDFIIAHLNPEVASWGSAEEIVTAVRMKKPVFISIEGGKQHTPLWLFGMIPHKYIYDNIQDVVKMIKRINRGSKKIDSKRWRLLRKEYRW